MSPTVTALLGWTPEQLLWKQPAQLLHPADLDRWLPKAAALLDGPQTFSTRLLTAMGGTVWVEIRTCPDASSDGTLRWVDGLVRNVTDTYAAMEQLRDGELRARKLLELASTVVLVMDPRGVLRYVSPAASRVFGLTGDDLRLFDRVHPEDLPRLRAQLVEIAARPWDTLTTVYRFHRGDGAWRVLESVVYNHLEDPAMKGLIASTQDITERHEAEAALRRSEQYHRELVTHFPGAIAVHRGHDIVYANPSLSELTGHSGGELIGKPFVALVPEDDRPFVHERIATVLRDGQAWKWEGRLLRRDGAVVLVDVTTILFAHEGAPAALSFLRDVTEYKRVQQQLMLADRMNSVGSLAGGVAHEINNPLAYVIGNLAFVQDQLARLPQTVNETAPWPDVQAAVRDSREGLDRVRRIVRDLRTIAQADEQGGPVDVSRVLDSCLNLAWLDIGHRAVLVKDFASVPSVAGNEARLSQVFLNLIMNAVEAMPEGRTHANELKVSVRPGPAGVEMTVRDTGVGIAPEVMPRIFDPFFSTKPSGIGTGLGLSICHSIVTSLGGAIRVASEVGRGTTVTVTLPVRSANAVISGHARRARLLLMDAPEALAESSRQALGARHELEMVSSMAEAKSKLANGRYDLLLCTWPLHAEVFESVIAGDPFMRRRFVMMTRAVEGERAVPGGVRAIRYQNRVELDVLLPAIREALDRNDAAHP